MKADIDKRCPGRSSKLDGWHAASVQYERGSVDPGVEKELRELVSRPSVHQYEQHAKLDRAAEDARPSLPPAALTLEKGPARYGDRASRTRAQGVHGHRQAQR